MDDPKPADDKNSSSPTPISVTDSGAVVKPSAPEVSATPSTPVETAAPMAQPPKDDVMPGLENESDTPPNDAPAPSASAADKAAVPSPANAVKKKGGGKAVLIALVVVIVLALAAVGYMAFVKDKDETATDSTTETTTQTTDTSETPDGASTAIDDSLKDLDDAKDFNSSDINDTTLGL